MTKVPLLKYIVKDGDRYVESTEGFELRAHGMEDNLRYNVYFNGFRIGHCEPAALSGPYKAYGPENQLLGEFADYIQVCEALKPYYTYRRKGGKPST